ncbi:MAG: SHOCT domain-containing protein [Alphaproteobacteria bacterium]
MIDQEMLMRKGTLFVASLLFALNASTAFADLGGDHGSMMMDGGMMAGGLMMVLFWAGLIAALFFAFRWFSKGAAVQPGTASAVDVLRERYARGEIDRAEFEERRNVLSAGEM